MTKKRNNLAEMLRDARVERGLSQGEVAKKLGLKSVQSVSDWERNHGSGVPVSTLKKLIDLYGMKPDDVFEALLEYQTQRLRERIEKKFFDVRERRARAGK